MASRRLLLIMSLCAWLPLTVESVAHAQEKIVRVGVNVANIAFLDPHRAQATADRALAGWMFNALVRFPPGSSDPAKLEPDLAERWESSPDGLTWTFHLRKGVKFHGTW